MFRCDSYDGGFNDMKYCNPECDALDELQLRELDREKRRELLIQQSQIVWDDLPVGIFRFGVDRGRLLDPPPQLLSRTATATLLEPAVRLGRGVGSLCSPAAGAFSRSAAPVLPHAIAHLSQPT